MKILQGFVAPYALEHDVTVGFGPGGSTAPSVRSALLEDHAAARPRLKGEGSSVSRPLGPPIRTDDRNVFDTIGDDYPLQDLARYGLLPTYRRYLPSANSCLEIRPAPPPRFGGVLPYRTLCV